ncbi:transcriptional regulator, Spx/MgsR family [Thalassospira xiamenensis M-5 = DSM 17429]|uniref:Arsenate reductase-like protein n=1 Tax=Thalassospira xiamenensis M-5 = DSM 17429 TaxID=1123366 RepID=A0AB72UCH7_9PROT|nr:ArsC/Spx/MgsR family protein [Thalassospira xiamenensis]AJD51894.1 arsenate reductase-like protein [Thalassospira xiamenensis M-5 = DSM 17429]SIS98611.1 transcriptional regulator, Spx/MgsR family [Thalassospira xiamenensis M-5 = DSM 17429]
MITVYGIKNCDTVKKSLKWFDAKGIDHKFHDFRIDGIDAKTIEGWLAEVGGKTLINKRGPSYRNLSDGDKAVLENDDAAAAVILAANPTVIKRPVVDFGTTRTVAYDEGRWSELAGA